MFYFFSSHCVRFCFLFFIFLQFAPSFLAGQREVWIGNNCKWLSHSAAYLDCPANWFLVTSRVSCKSGDWAVISYPTTDRGTPTGWYLGCFSSARVSWQESQMSTGDIQILCCTHPTHNVGNPVCSTTDSAVDPPSGMMLTAGGGDCRGVSASGFSSYIGASFAANDLFGGWQYFPPSRAGWYFRCMRPSRFLGAVLGSTLTPAFVRQVQCKTSYFQVAVSWNSNSFVLREGGFCSNNMGLTTTTPNVRCDSPTSDSNSQWFSGVRMQFACPPVPTGSYSWMNIASAPTSSVASGSSATITCADGYFNAATGTVSTSVTCGASTPFFYISRCSARSCSAPGVSGGSWSNPSPLFGSYTALQCNTGFISNNILGYCGYNANAGVMEFYSNGAACSPFTVSNIAVDHSQSTNYRLVVTWSPSSAAGMQSYRIGYSRTFPSFGTTEYNANQASLGGILVDSTQIGSVAHSSSINRYSFTINVDSFRQIAGIRGTISVTPISSSAVGTTSTVSFRLPCACDFSQDLDGTVQRFSVFQDLEANQLMIRFTPNSLCAKTYRILVVGDQSIFAVVNATVDTLLIQTADSCPFRSQVVAAITPVDGLVIRPCLNYTYRIAALPQPICPTCITQFSIGNSLPTASLVFAANFSFLVTGQVTTPIGPASPTGVGIPEIAITVDVFALSDPGYRSSLWSQQVITNSLGNFRVRISSARLPNPPYLARVMASKREKLSNGSFFDHEFVSTFNQSNAAFFMRVEMDQRTEGVGFYDISTVQITARIVTNFVYVDESLNRYFQLSNPILQAAQSSSTAALGTSGSCGVPNVVITSYRSSDAKRSNPLSVSEVSDAQGYVYISTPIFSNIVLVPSYSTVQAGSGTEKIVHTFSPSSVSVVVATEPVILAPIADTTMAELNITFLGGVTRSHIGAIRPVLQFSTCSSANNRIPLAPAGVPGRWNPNTKSISYRLPAQRFALFWSAPFSGVRTGFQPADSGNPFTFKPNNLPDTLSRPVGGSDPYFIDSDVATWVRNLPNQEIDLLRGGDSIELIYYAVPIATLKDPDGAQRCNVTQPGGFYGLKKHSQVTMMFELTEIYGPSSSLANPAYVYSGFEINRNVSATVIVNDGFSDASAQLTAPPEGSCENRVCSILAVFDPVMRRTTANYSLTVGEIQVSPNTPFGIPYARQSSFFANGSRTSTGILNRQAPKSVYAVITGKLVYPGAYFVTYPPQSPLYIVREPAGSDSYAYLSSGTELHTALSFSRGLDTQGEQIRQFTPYTDQDSSTCVGLGAAVCKKIGGFLIKTRLEFNERSAAPTSTKSSALFTYSFEQTIRTAGVREKRGDVFITLSASVAIQKAIEVSLTNPGCGSSSQTLLTWTIDPEKTLEFIDEYAINNVMIPDLEAVLAVNLALLGYPTFAAFETANFEPREASFYESLSPSIRSKIPETAKNTKDVGLAIRDWRGLINWNNYLKASASVFVDFLQHVNGPADFEGWKSGENPYSAQQYADSRVETALEKTPDKSETSMEPIDRDSLELRGRDSAFEAMTMDVSDVLGAAVAFAVGFDPVRAYKNIDAALDTTFPKLPNTLSPKAALVADSTFGSFTFYGGGTQVEMTLETKLGKSHDASKGAMYMPSVKTGTDGEATILGVGFKTDIGSESFFQFSHNAEEFASSDLTNRIGVVLQDLDAGDEFKIAILKDDVYSAPVFRLLAGKSRCINEPGTMARDSVEFTLGNSAITDVHPDEPAATSITMTNVSPTAENFTYSLTVDETTNRNGLILSINGQILNSDEKAFRVYLPYSVPVTLILEAKRSRVARYSFHGIQIFLSDGEDGSCYQTSTFLSVDFLSPCNQLQFAGTYTADVPFSVNLADLSGVPSIPIAISNPQRSVPWFKWHYNAGLGKLQSIILDYRSVDSSERDWLALRDLATGQAVSIQLPTSPTQPNQDFAIFNWDVSSLIEGEFYIRARTRCVTVSSVDPSLNGFTGPIMRGRIDQKRPTVFGFPHPSQYEKYIPGTEISIAFTEPIQCEAITASYWVNPRGIPLSGPLNFPQASQANLVRDAYTQCDQLHERVYIAFAAPNLLQMDDVVISVLLAGVKDLAANPLNYKALDYATWSFTTANLTSLKPFLPGFSDVSAPSAPVDSSNSSVPSNGDSYLTSLVVSLAADLSVLTSSYGSQTALIQRLQEEIQELIVTSSLINETSQEAVQRLILQNVQLENLDKLDKLHNQSLNIEQRLTDLTRTVIGRTESEAALPSSISNPNLPANSNYFLEPPTWFDASQGFNHSHAAKFEFAAWSGDFVPSLSASSLHLLNGSVNSSTSVWFKDPFPYLGQDQDFLIELSTSQRSPNQTVGRLGDGFTLTFASISNHIPSNCASGAWSFMGAYSPECVDSPSFTLGFNFLASRVDISLNGSLSTLQAEFIPRPLKLSEAELCTYSILYKANAKLFQITLSQTNWTTSASITSTLIIRLAFSLADYFRSFDQIRFGFTAGSGLIPGIWNVRSLRITSPLPPAQAIPMSLSSVLLQPSGRSYGARSGTRSVNVGNLVFLLGGRSASTSAADTCSSYNDVQIYDGNRANRWFTLTKAAEFPARSHHGLVFSGGSLYVFGGRQCNGSLLSDVWRSGSNDRLGLDWQLLSSADFTRSGLSAADSFPFASVGQTIYMVQNSLQLFKLNATSPDGWKPVGQPVQGFTNPKYSSMLLVSGQLFLHLASWIECGYCTSSLQFYFDFASETWIQLSARPTSRLPGRLDRALSVFGSRIYAVGGVDADDIWSAAFDSIVMQNREIEWIKAPISLSAGSQSQLVGGNLVSIPGRMAMFAFAFSDHSAVQILCPLIEGGTRCVAPFSSELPEIALRFAGSSISSGSLVFRFDLHRPQLSAWSADADPSAIAHQLYSAAQLRLHEDSARFQLLSLLDCSVASHNESLANCAQAIRSESRVEIASHLHLVEEEDNSSDLSFISPSIAAEFSSAIADSSAFLGLQISSALTISRPDFGAAGGAFPWHADTADSLAFGNTTMFIRWHRPLGRPALRVSNMRFSAHLAADEHRIAPSQLTLLTQMHQRIRQREAENPFAVECDGSQSALSACMIYSEEVSAATNLIHSQLVIPHLPVLVGGSEYQFRLTAGPNSLHSKVFLAGPPSPPRYIRSSQTVARQLLIHFLPSVQSGLTHQSELENIDSTHFAVYCRIARARANVSHSQSHDDSKDPESYMRLPGSIAKIELSNVPFRVESILRVDLEQLSTHYGIPINSTSIDFALQTFTQISSSKLTYFTSPLVPPPLPITIPMHSIRRVAFSSFEVTVQSAAEIDTNSIQLAVRVGSPDSVLFKSRRSVDHATSEVLADSEWRLTGVTGGASAVHPDLFTYSFHLAILPEFFGRLNPTSAAGLRQLEIHVSHSNSIGEQASAINRWTIPSPLIWLAKPNRFESWVKFESSKAIFKVGPFVPELADLPSKLSGLIVDSIIGFELSVTIESVGVERKFQHWRHESSASASEKSLVDMSASWIHLPSEFGLTAFPADSVIKVSVALLTDLSFNVHERHPSPHLDPHSAAILRCPPHTIESKLELN